VKRLGYGAMQLAGPGVFGPPKDRTAALAVLCAVFFMDDVGCFVVWAARLSDDATTMTPSASGKCCRILVRSFLRKPCGEGVIVNVFQLQCGCPSRTVPRGRTDRCASESSEQE